MGRHPLSCGGAYLRHICSAVPGGGEMAPSQASRLRHLLNRTTHHAPRTAPPAHFFMSLNCILLSLDYSIAMLCQSGGIGRRAAFRSQCPQGREGSNPFSGTSSFCCFLFWHLDARVAELADALRSGRSVRKDVKVQILSLVPGSFIQFRPAGRFFFVKSSFVEPGSRYAIPRQPRRCHSRTQSRLERSSLEEC